MIKVKCRYCDYKVKKPKWEHIIHTIRKQGGDILKNVCPGCKKKGLELDWGEEAPFSCRKLIYKTNE